MKHFIFMLAAVLLIRCQDTTIDDLSSRRAYAVMNLTGDEKRLAFNLLSLPEKSIFWSQKLNAHLAGESFTAQQRELVQILKEAVDAELINEDPKTFNEFRDRWILKARVSFDRAAIARIAFSLDHKPIILNFRPAQCQCSVGSIFSCVLNGWCSTTGACDPAYLGCGFLGMGVCDGTCTKISF